MSSKVKKVEDEVAKLPPIPKELVDVLSGQMTNEAISEAGAAFKKSPIAASLNAELNHLIGYAPGLDNPLAAPRHPTGKVICPTAGETENDPKHRKADAAYLAKHPL